MHPFRAAVESGDVDNVIALLADDVVFHSPVVLAPYRGRHAVEQVLRAAARVFEDVRYEREIGADLCNTALEDVDSTQRLHRPHTRRDVGRIELRDPYDL